MAEVLSERAGAGSARLRLGRLRRGGLVDFYVTAGRGSAAGWSQAWVPDAVGLGDFVLWLDGAQAWLVGNGIEDTLGELQLVRTS